MGQTKTSAKGKAANKGRAAKPAARPDRSLVEGGEDYPVRELAVATGIPLDEADALVDKHGVSSKAAQEARAMQREQAEEEEAARG